MPRSVWICALAVLCLTVNSSRVYAQQCVAPPSGLVAWYPGDNSFGDMASTRVARPIGTVAFTAGKVGNAFQLDGSTGWIDVTQPALNVGTVEFWANPASLPQDTRFFSQTSGSTTQGGATGFNIIGDNQIAVWTGGAWVPLHGSLQAGTWTHLVFAYDGTQVVLYV